MKKILLGIGILLVLVLVLIVLLPFIVDLNSYQAQYRPVIEEALNRKVVLKDIRLTIIPRIGVWITEFTVMDDPAFGAQPFASLSSLDIGVKLRPLLQKRVEVEEVTLRDPIISVIKNSHGVLNTATLGKKAQAKPEPQAAPSAEGPLHVLTMLAVDQVSIKGESSVTATSPRPSLQTTSWISLSFYSMVSVSAGSPRCIWPPPFSRTAFRSAWTGGSGRSKRHWILRRLTWPSHWGRSLWPSKEATSGGT